MVKELSQLSGVWWVFLAKLIHLASELPQFDAAWLFKEHEPRDGPLVFG